MEIYKLTTCFVFQLMVYNAILLILLWETLQIFRNNMEYIVKLKMDLLVTKIMVLTAFQIPGIIAQPVME